MIGGNELCFVTGGGDKSASGQMVCFSEQAAGSLVHRSYGLFFKRIVFQSGKIEMMEQILLHPLPVHGLEMRASDDPGRQGNSGSIEQVVRQVLLAGEDDRQPWF